MLRGDADYVSPVYTRAVTEGTLTTNLLAPLVRSLFGKRLQESGLHEEAIAQYTKALAHREHDARALTGLSRAHALIAQSQIFAASDFGTCMPGRTTALSVGS